MPEEIGVIRFATLEPLCITVEEYRTIYKNVCARIMAGDQDVGDRVLMRLLYEHHPRYWMLAHPDEEDV